MAKKKGATINVKKYKYVTLRIRDASGAIHHSRGNGDAIHRALLLHTAVGGTMKDIIAANNFEKFDGGGNEGTLRMSVGVALRAAVRSGEPVKIGKLRIASLRQKVELPKVETKATEPRKAAKKSGKKVTKKSPSRKARKPRATPAPTETATEAAAPSA